MVKLSALLMLIGPASAQTDDIFSDTRPTRPNGGESSSSGGRPTSSGRPNNTRPTDVSDSSGRPGSNSSISSNYDNDNTDDDEQFLPSDDEWYLPLSSTTIHVFASGNPQDWGSTDNSTNTTNTSMPVLIDEVNIVAVAAGQVHSVLLTEDGTIMTGGIVEGGLGLGRNFTEGFGSVTKVYGDSTSGTADGEAAFNTTTTTSTLPKFVNVYASQYFTMALDENGNVWSTGSNNHGQLCLGDDVDRDLFEMINPRFYSDEMSHVSISTTAPPEGVFDMLEPPTSGSAESTSVENVETGVFDRTLQANSTKIIDVALGERHSLLLREDGRVLACGWNQFGQLGLNSSESTVSRPTPVMLNEAVVEVTAGRGSSYFRTQNDTIYVTGTNYDGQLCLGDREDRYIPTLMDPFQKDDGLDESNADIQSIIAGKSSLYMHLSDGRVLGCGENSHGQLGVEDTNIDVASLLPLQDVTSIFSGPLSYSAFFVQNNGTIYALGYNGGGHLGVGDGTNRNAPAVVGCSDVQGILDEEMAFRVLISSGNDHTLFLGTASTFLCDGKNAPTSSPTITSSPTTTAAPTTSPTITASPTRTPMPTSATKSSTDVPTTSSIPSMTPTYPKPSPDGLNSSNRVSCGFSLVLLFLGVTFSYDTFIQY